jgi:cytochrome c peroxidase
VSLGRALFHEPLLSDGHDVSCNSCHALNARGTDGRRVSLGHDGRAGTRNAPTEYNAAGHLAQFWDGRARDVEAQANGPILNPIEVGMPDSAAVLAHLRASPMYVAAFRAAFPAERDPISYDNAGRAIGAFERGLVTPAPWDRFLAGDSTAFTTEQRRGLRSFLNAGCQSCHAGINVGGDRFEGRTHQCVALPNRQRTLSRNEQRTIDSSSRSSLRNIAHAPTGRWPISQAVG